MKEIKKFIDKLNQPKIYLLFANVVLVLALILLSNASILPVKSFGDFLFFTLIYLAFALYRPGWSFLFFVGTIALENINLAPSELGIMIRPYQFVGGLTILAVLIKVSVKRLEFKLPKWNWYDLFFIIFTATGFLSAIFALDKGISFKQSIIAASFVVIYFLVRIFIQETDDLKRMAPFFMSSGMIVVFYSLWQNIRFSGGLNSFEMMPGRPNGTFTEPDWLGIFLVFLVAIFYVLIYHLKSLVLDGQENKIRSYKLTYLYSCLILVYSVLIATVSRSAWLAAFGVTVGFLFIIFTRLKMKVSELQWKTTVNIKIRILLSVMAALAIVNIFHLTNFQLLNRVQSTGTGLQKITISCANANDFEIQQLEQIERVEQLERLGCRHINLEEIENEITKGNFVKEIFRIDPNVDIRSEIYRKSWNEIKNHPILGIGWGNIGKILGDDGRGATLNSSNIFLEIWLGSGITGLVSVVLFIILVLVNAVGTFISDDLDGKIFSLVIIIGMVGFIIANLFNAGIFLGIAWLFFGIANKKKSSRK